MFLAVVLCIAFLHNSNGASYLLNNKHELINKPNEGSFKDNSNKEISFRQKRGHNYGYFNPQYWPAPPSNHFIENDKIIFPDDDNYFRDQIPDRNRGFNWGNHNFGHSHIAFDTPTSTQRPTSTIAIPGMATTRSACEDACQATTQFDPVCGDNMVTYTNIQWLRCAQRCGRKVNVKYRGACPRMP